MNSKPFRLIVAVIVYTACASAAPVFAGQTEGDFIIKDFHFNSGEVLPALRLHYVTLGTPHRNSSGEIDNAVLLLHSTGSDTTEFFEASFSGPLYGPGQPLDLSKFYVIIPDAIGHGKSSKPSDGLRGHFPHYGYEDIVAAQHRLVTEKLGVTHLRLVLGLSMGGMQTWLWGERYPEMMDALFPISALPVETGGRNRLWRHAVVEAIHHDPEWKNGDYEQQPHGFARIVPLIAMMVSNPVRQYEKYPTRAAADGWYDRMTQSAYQQADVNDSLYHYEASSDYDPAPDLEKIRARLLLILFEDDQINSPEFGALDREMPRLKNVRFVILPADKQSNGEGNNTDAARWRSYLEDVLRSSTNAEAARTPYLTSADSPQPASEMQSLTKALMGTWSITEKYEPDERRPNGGTGYGEEIWRRGPGGFTLMEEVHDRAPNGESFGLALAWWDKEKGLQGMWCVNSNPKGCDAPGSIASRWDGKQLVIENEFEKDGKKFMWHEVYSDITPTSFLQTADIGEKGKSLKRWLTIRATRVATEPPNNCGMQSSSVAPGPEMQKLADILSGRWTGTLRVEPTPGLPSGGTGEVSEVWRASPGGMPLVEENRIRRMSGESYDYAAIWWNSKARKYQGIWCADINDEGCNGFEAKLERNQVVMTGEWEQQGKRRAWREVVAPTSTTSVTQSLEIGEPGGEMKRVSAIHAMKVTEAPTMDARAAESELLAAMEERRKASLEGDTEKIAASMADEYLQTDIGGYVQDRTAWLNEYFKPLAELIKAGKFRWEAYERKDVQFRMYGDCAVVMGTLELKGSGARYDPAQHTWVADPNASFSGTLHFTHVNVKRNGKWLLAALHNAVPLPPPSANK